MRAYSYFGLWCVLGGVALACSGTSFTAGEGGDSGSGGSGDTSSGGVTNRAGQGNGGSKLGNGGKANAGTDAGGTDAAGADTAGTDTGGTTTSGGSGTAGDVSIGGDVSVAGTASTGGSSAGTGSVAGAAGTNGGPPVDVVCPKSQPSDGGLCKDGLTCTYGTDLRAQCRSLAKCDGGKWAVTKSACVEMHGCQNVLVGKACSPDAPDCMLGDQGVFCVCAECNNASCGSPYTWACAGGQGGNACPKAVPNWGQPCANDAKCPYGSCDTGGNVTAACVDATWSWEQNICVQPL